MIIFSNGVLDFIPKAQAIATKTDQVNFLRTKNFCTSKDIIKKVKDNLQNGRKYLRIMYHKH